MPSYVAFILFVFTPALILALLIGANWARVESWLDGATGKLGENVGTAIGLLLYKYAPSPTPEAIAAGYRAAELGEAIDRSLRATLVEDSILFLHEVELGTKREFARVDGNVVHVTRRHMRQIEDFTRLSEQYGHSAIGTFTAHGYELVVLGR